MRSCMLVVVALLGACDAGKLTCKDAVVKARAGLHFTEDEAAMTIGTCELHDWSGTARSCVATAKTDDALAACTADISGHSAKFAESLATMRRFTDEMCRCHDTACATHVSDELTTWGQDQAKYQVKPPKLTDTETKLFTELGEQMGKCMQQAMTPPTEPQPQVLPIQDR